MERTYIRRADGRYVALYAGDPPVVETSSGELMQLLAGREPRPGDPELRWNPLRGEWTIIAGSRMDRPLTAAGDACLLCPGSPELPEPYTIACFENRYPSFRPGPPAGETIAEPGLFRTARATGLCEVVVFTPEHDASLSSLAVDQLERIVVVLADRCRELATLPGIKYVYPFENRGAAVGVTLHHPHGQIYAFPYVPPIVAAEWTIARSMARSGRCLFCEIVRAEEVDGRRIIAVDDHFSAFIPFAARYPYEVQIVARRHGAATLPDLDPVECRRLAGMLALVVRKYDQLFGFPMPYLLMLHPAPVRAVEAPACWHFHVELYPIQRSRDKLKYRASVETGAGSFINDAYPEEKADELRAVPPRTLADLSDDVEDQA